MNTNSASFMSLGNGLGGDRNSRGIAMIAALGLMAIAGMVMMLLFMRTMDEVRHGADDAGIVQTLLVAHGGANMGIALLRSDIYDQLNLIASAESNSTGSWSFGSSNTTATEPEPASVARDLKAVADALQPRIDAILCGDHDFSGGQVLNLRIYVTSSACGEPLPSGTRLGDGRFISGYRRERGGEQRYALPFVMVADGVQGQYQRRVATQGEYQFVVGRMSFARYALFTDEHVSATSNAARIWFNDDTLFDGPVHTNGNFNFSGEPWFGGEVTSAGTTQGVGQGAYGYNTSDGEFFSANQLDGQGNSPDLSTPGYSNRPLFSEGVDFRATEIELPENAHDQATLAAQNGISIDGNVQRLTLFAGDSAGQAIPADSDTPAAYQFVVVDRGSAGTENYRISPDGRLERLQGTNWQLVTPSFNGLIHVDGNIRSLTGGGRSNPGDPDSARPAIAAFSQITVVPEDGARITGDLVYEEQPCSGALHRDASGNVIRSVCENLDALNVLGVFVPNGDLTIGHDYEDSSLNAPEDVRIQGSLMTSNGIVTVDNYDSGANKGSVQLLGGIIERKYGAFGTFVRGGGMSTGYSREFTFDPRLRRGLTPPYFPTVGLDDVKYVLTFTFGHREQVY